MFNVPFVSNEGYPCPSFFPLLPPALRLQRRANTPPSFPTRLNPTAHCLPSLTAIHCPPALPCPSFATKGKQDSSFPTRATPHCPSFPTKGKQTSSFPTRTNPYFLTFHLKILKSIFILSHTYISI